ncbi:MAG: threonine--tRNA ligase [Candidatus Cloacimonetes bacterium]|nr:threonine--tRNA ligase [Candidatus Cloacimonadota bacterium]MDY0337275.1 threonine--tRNA ligase [Candidatus Cloacimonadaceae bacterium]MCK9333717.1 threonine--tRNA ligase [Candidatus Cloacimonadota bacterium]MDD2682658.1 threonine--tRNA ligase [Candidatus Cloacimonadota bacterium]MDD3577522.1 threonine--tRNA ligase [Candidatus Cloacimonadota bacterium]
MAVIISLPDGSTKEYPGAVSALDIAKDISPRLADAALAAEINGKMVDINSIIDKDASVVIHTFKTEAGRQLYWHSTAHLMAQAVKQLFPKVQVTIGPAIDQGFYYDFDRDEPFTEEDLLNIEQRMKELIANDLPYTRRELGKAEAIEAFRNMGENYKIEILSEIPDGDVISTYTQGDFIDLCRGPHIPSTGKIKAVKLLKSSGAYWRGDEKNKMLKRIYGISFPSNKELNEYLNFLEEAAKRDHRKLGKDLDLFSINDEVGPGLVLWHPNGAMIRHQIESFWKDQHLKNGYQLVYSPHVGRSNLWETSGHLGFYKENMYSKMDVEGADYYIKPMNCPFHLSIYNANHHSYRELPIRLAELGTVYRYERSGVLHGLMRVRGFTQDDAHIICTPEQVSDEVEKLIVFSLDMLKSFGFQEFMIYLSTRPEASVGKEEDWDMATQSLKASLMKLNLPFDIDEGGGAFYGPKIDIKIKDAIGRAWQCTTIQFDFNLPERFDMQYIGSDNAAHRPYMIHRAVLGSVERFFATLLEYHGGNLPLWLAPNQMMILPITDAQIDYAKYLQERFLAEGLRCEVDFRSEKIGYKIREAELKKIPFMCIVGKKEAEESMLTLRRHTKGDLGAMTFDAALQAIKSEL